MHPEPIYAGVVRVAPVAQHLQQDVIHKPRELVLKGEEMSCLFLSGIQLLTQCCSNGLAQHLTALGGLWPRRSSTALPHLAKRTGREEAST